MATRLLIAAAAAGLIAAPVLAHAGPDMPAEHKDHAKPAAATGAATDTSGVIGMADLPTGAAVRDASGARIGTIAKVKEGKAGGAADVTLDVDGKMATVPASTLTLSGGALVSSKTKAEILAGAQN